MAVWTINTIIQFSNVWIMLLISIWGFSESCSCDCSCPCLLMNICIYFCWISTWGWITESEGMCLFRFNRYSQFFFFFKWLYHLSSRYERVLGTPHAYPSPIVGIFGVFHFSHVVVLICIFLNDSWCWAFLHVHTGHVDIIFCEVGFLLGYLLPSCKYSLSVICDMSSL